VFTKLPLSWSRDEQFVAFPLPADPSTTRVVDLSSGAFVDGSSSLVGASPIFNPRAAIPPADPGTTMPRVTSHFARPDGSATTYLDFDSSAGGRWFGERVEVSTGAR